MQNNSSLTKDKITESILAITTGMLAIALIFKIDWLLIVAVIIGAIGLLIPPLAKLIARAWMKFAEILGYINSRILLAVVFYIFLFPIAVLSRLFIKDPLQLKPKKSGSYFTERNHEFTAEDFKNPW